MANRCRRTDLRRARRAIPTALGLAVALCGCARQEPVTAELHELRAPVVDGLDPEVRDQLEQSLESVHSYSARADAEPRKIGEAYGELGRLYQTYELFDAALPAYLNAGLLSPDDYRWPYYLGHIHRSMFDLEAAQRSFERASELRPDDAPTLLALGQVHREVGRLDEAAQYANEVLAIDARSSGALLLLADLAVDRGDPAAAVEWYERLLEQQPAATRVHQPLALAFRSLGRLDEARAHLELRGDGPVEVDDPLMNELRSLASGSRRHLDTGVTLFQQGDFEAAAAAFERAVSSDPRLVPARINLGSALARLGRLDEAGEQYREVLVLEPEHALTHYNLGVILTQLGRPEEGLSHYEQALRIDPGYHAPRFNLANSLRQSGRCAEALEHYDLLRVADPGNVSVRAGEALCLAELGRIDSARSRLNEGLAVVPDDRLMVQVSARILAASPHDDLRDGARALVLAERLVAERRDRVGLETLAMALAELGRFEEASAIQREAIGMIGNTGRPELSARLRGNLERYERGEACRDPAIG